MSSQPLKKGDWAPASATDLRAPCPFVNSLANHGLINRDGRAVTVAQITEAMRSCGLGPDVAYILCKAAYSVHSDVDNPTNKEEGYHLGLRDAGDVNAQGVKVLDLDKFGRPHAMEHDVSLARQDRELADPFKIDQALLEKLLKADEGKGYFTLFDLARRRKERYDEAKRDNPQLHFDQENHRVGCSEAGALVGVFGQGLSYRIPKEYIEALFRDERLPYKEGWKPRWIPMLAPEVLAFIKTISYYCWPF